MSNKKLSIDTVNTVAEFLLLTFGSTTSLDVKNNLRKLGFQADQAEVSEYLNKIYTARKAGEYAPYELNGKTVELTFENKVQAGKTFKLYSFKAPETKAPVPDAPAKAATTATTLTAPATRTKAQIKDYIRRNINSSSANIARVLGISVGSVAAYKANLNR